MVVRRKVSFSPAAEADLDRLFFYIAEQSSPLVADRYLLRLEKTCQSLRVFPNRGTALPGLKKGMRSMGFERRVTILFQIREDEIEILRVLYAGRRAAPPGNQ